MDRSQQAETPAPTSMARSQTYQLPSSRPREEDREQGYSPVPYHSVKGSKSARKPSEKALKKKSLSANLKENAGPRKSSTAGPKASLLGTKSPGIQHHKRRGESAARQIAKYPSIASLASAFQSHPSSPALSYCSSPNASKSKRVLADISVHPNVSPCIPLDPRGLKMQRRSLPATDFEAQGSGRGFLLQGSPTDAQNENQPPTHLVKKHAVYGLDGLLRRPSHPTLGSGPRRSLSRKFTPRSALESVDFDRPPSQLSMYDLGPLNMEEGSEGDGSSHEQNDLKVVPFEEFAAGSFEISTPQELLVLESGATRPSRTTCSTPPRQSGKTLEVLSGSTASKRTESMSLTSVEDAQHAHYDLTDRSPWVSDSIISPPTVYLNRHRAQPDTYSGRGNGGGKHCDASPVSQGLQPALEIVVSSSKTSVGRTRSGTVTQTSPAVTTVTSPPSGRNRSGTLTQDTYKSAAPPLIDLALASKKGRRDSDMSLPVSRKRSNTIRPAVITRTSTGALVGLQALPTSTIPISDVPVPLAPQSVSEPAPLDDQGFFDTEFDPNPEDLLVFSSAKNPDVEELDFYFDEDGTNGPARLDLPMELGSNRSHELSLDHDPLNLGTDLLRDLPMRPAASKQKQIKIRWVAPPPRPGKGKDKEHRRSATGPKASRGFRKALGLGRDNGARSSSRGNGVLGGRLTENEYSPPQSPTSSTDPIDFLSPLDDDLDLSGGIPPDVPTETATAVNQPAKEKGKAPRRKSFSARLEGMVPGKG
ncbi:hypothetical protein BKA70DRAFT_1569304 [Coprinopsis sp. MPI-PUGE-AT-0042]|nr:hypothetical protein BKA70DRAFT_1569304 [Coprinopsis sp. MPI-PUGE-AT-0042]